MKRIISFIPLWLGIISVAAQTNYYATTKTFRESGYTYQCDVSAGGMVTLYNVENQLTYTDVIYKATGKHYMPELGDPYDLFEDDTWTRQLCYSIVDKAFSDTEKLRVKGDWFGVTMCINSQTGKVDEVYFNFVTFDPYVTIPVSVYRKVETEIKNRVWFTPNAEGRKMNYIFQSFSIEPKVISPPKPAQPSWNGDLVVQLGNFSPRHRYGEGNSLQWPKSIYPDMFNFTDNRGAFDSNIYISGIGKAMLDLIFYNQTDHDIALTVSKIKVRLEIGNEYIYPEVAIYNYNNGTPISIDNQTITIPSEGGNCLFTLAFNNIFGNMTSLNIEPYDCKLKLFYDGQSMLGYIIDDRYEWNTDNDYVVGTWYRGGHIMLRYMYNPNRQEMYYNRITRDYVY